MNQIVNIILMYILSDGFFLLCFLFCNIPYHFIHNFRKNVQSCNFKYFVFKVSVQNACAKFFGYCAMSLCKVSQPDLSDVQNRKNVRLILNENEIYFLLSVGRIFLTAVIGSSNVFFSCFYFAFSYFIKSKLFIK